MVQVSGRSVVRTELSMLVAACALAIGIAAPLEAQLSGADSLADEIALTELGPGSAEDAPPEAERELTAAGPVQVSILDIAAKLAVLVLLVYAVAWGAKYAQRGGFRLARAAMPNENRRLRQCADLALRGGATLHIIAVDEHPLLIATHGAGEVSLLLDLRQGDAAPEDDPALRMSPESERGLQASDSRAASALRLDNEWEQRRDSLIRALQSAQETTPVS